MSRAERTGIGTEKSAKRKKNGAAASNATAPIILFFYFVRTQTETVWPGS